MRHLFIKFVSVPEPKKEAEVVEEGLEEGLEEGEEGEEGDVSQASEDQ